MFLVFAEIRPTQGGQTHRKVWPMRIRKEHIHPSCQASSCASRKRISNAIMRKRSIEKGKEIQRTAQTLDMGDRLAILQMLKRYILVSQDIKWKSQVWMQHCRVEDSVRRLSEEGRSQVSKTPLSRQQREKNAPCALMALVEFSLVSFYQGKNARQTSTSLQVRLHIVRI